MIRKLKKQSNLLMAFFQQKMAMNFSSNERFGKDDETATKRIPELIESMNLITSVFQEAMNHNKNLIITSTLTIEFADVIDKMACPAQ